MLSIIPEETQAILIGTSEFTNSELHNLPSVKNNIKELAKLLKDRDLIGIPGENVTKILNELYPASVEGKLLNQVQKASDTLIVYYAGHGLISGPSNELLLSVKKTRKDLLSSALSWNHVSQAINNSTARKKIVIVDCCYSGRVCGTIMSTNEMRIDSESIRTEIEKDLQGSYTIASVAENETALAPTSAYYTAFSGVLIDTIKNGIDNQKPYITVHELFRSIETKLEESSSPTPIKSTYRDGDEIIIFKNSKFRAKVPDKDIFIGNANERTDQQSAIADKLSKLGGKLLAIGFVLVAAKFMNSYSACNKLPDGLTCGGNLDFLTDIRPGPLGEFEKQGTRAFSQGKYQEAIKELTSAQTADPDPYTLIARNNAEVLRDLNHGEISGNNIFIIAISSGLDKEPKFIGKNILAGVALRQDEVNRKSRLDKDKDANLPDDFRLIVVIAKDSNEQNKAEQRAKEIINTKNILGVIGPYSSHATYYVMDDYFKKLALVSPTSTASLDTYEKVDELDGKKEINFSWFFRPTPTTTQAAEDLVSYLKNHGCENQGGCEKIILFHRADKLLGKSFYHDFTAIAKDPKYKLNIVEEYHYIDPDLKKLEEIIDRFKKSGDREKTALVLLPDAYIEKGASDKIAEIIKYNQGELFVAGNNILHDPNVLELVKQNKDLDKMVISVPWFSPEKFNDGDLASKLDSDLDLSWHMAMSYDATQMLVEAISKQLSENRKPDRDGTREVLADSNFQTQGLTGTIMLDGSERKDPFSALIRPHCCKESCKWLKIEPATER